MIGTSATITAELREPLAVYNVTYVTCGQRPYVLKNQVDVHAVADIYECMCFTRVSLLARQIIVLMFLPGKAEIA